MTTDPNIRRKRILIFTFIIQVLSTFNGQVIGELVKSGRLQISPALFGASQLTILLLVHILAFITIRVFLKKRIYVLLYGIDIFGAFVLITMSRVPTLPSEIVGPVTAIGILLGLISMIIWFAVIVKDIFGEVHDLTYRIIGAANIYSLLIAIFGYTYFGFEFLFPGSLSVPLITGNDLITACFKLSLHTMVGIDHHFLLTPSLENLTLLQSMISHLFIVFLVGRLLTK